MISNRHRLWSAWLAAESMEWQTGMPAQRATSFVDSCTLQLFYLPVVFVAFTEQIRFALLFFSTQKKHCLPFLKRIVHVGSDQHPFAKKNVLLFSRLVLMHSVLHTTSQSDFGNLQNYKTSARPVVSTHDEYQKLKEYNGSSTNRRDFATRASQALNFVHFSL